MNTKNKTKGLVIAAIIAFAATIFSACVPTPGGGGITPPQTTDTNFIKKVINGDPNSLNNITYNFYYTNKKLTALSYFNGCEGDCPTYSDSFNFVHTNSYIDQIVSGHSLRFSFNSKKNITNVIVANSFGLIGPNIEYKYKSNGEINTITHKEIINGSNIILYKLYDFVYDNNKLISYKTDSRYQEYPNPPTYLTFITAFEYGNDTTSRIEIIYDIPDPLFLSQYNHYSDLGLSIYKLLGLNVGKVSNVLPTKRTVTYLNVQSGGAQNYNVIYTYTKDSNNKIIKENALVSGSSFPSYIDTRHFEYLY